MQISISYQQLHVPLEQFMEHIRNMHKLYVKKRYLSGHFNELPHVHPYPIPGPFEESRNDG